MIKAIIFDCFGVLVADALRPRADAIAKDDPTVAESFYGIMRELDLGLIIPEQGFKEIGAILGMPGEEVAELSRQGEVRNAALIEHIPGFKKAHKIGLLSNVQSRRWLEDRFLPGELDQLFDQVIASGEVGMVKPDPGIYQLMATRLGVDAADCVMIDDRQSGVDGALAAGMKAIHYTGNDQALTELHALLND